MTYPRKLVANRHKIGVRVWSAKESQPLRPIEIKRERESFKSNDRWWMLFRVTLGTKRHYLV